MEKYQSLEHEWRVQPDRQSWNKLMESASHIPGVVVESGRVSDLVLGRHGFDSVAIDGFIVRLRGPEPYRLELKERLQEGVWQETTIKIDSAAAALVILKRLDLRPHLVIDRTRYTFKSKQFVLCFDDVDNLGCFVEVEAESASAASDPLTRIVTELNALPHLPPYGDIVRDRLLDGAFRLDFEKYLHNYADKLGENLAS